MGIGDGVIPAQPVVEVEHPQMEVPAGAPIRAECAAERRNPHRRKPPRRPCPQGQTCDNDRRFRRRARAINLSGTFNCKPLRQSPMSLYFSAGSATTELSGNDLRSGLVSALESLDKRQKVLVVPPDITRYHSMAGELTRYAWEYYGDRLTDIMPALGTHAPMTDAEIGRMFPGVPPDLFRVHDWRGRAGHAGRSARRVRSRDLRGQARVRMARAGEPAARRGRL